MPAGLSGPETAPGRRGGHHRHYTPEQAASCMMSVWRCAGREATGNVVRCHPEAEPGGWHVGFGMLLLPETYATREEAVDWARALAQWVAVAISYERRGLFGKHTHAPDPAFEPPSVLAGEEPAQAALEVDAGKERAG